MRPQKKPLRTTSFAKKFAVPFQNWNQTCITFNTGNVSPLEVDDGVRQGRGFLGADRHFRASRKDRALSGAGLPDRRNLEDAAGLLDQQSPDPDQGKEA